MNAKDLQSVPVRLLWFAAVLLGGLLVAGSLCTCAQDEDWGLVHVTVHFDPDMVPDPPGSSEYLEIALETDSTDMSNWANLDYYKAELLWPQTLSSWGVTFPKVTYGTYYLGARIDLNDDQDFDDPEDYIGYYGAINPAIDPANAEVVGPDFTTDFSFTIQ